MYYEVYGQGKPMLLLHGSYFTIPLNWSHVIPLLAKDRKVIAVEMQGMAVPEILPASLAMKV